MKRLLLGPHAVEEALRAAPKQIAVIYAVAGSAAELLQLAERTGVRVEPRGRSELDAMAGGRRLQGMVGIGGEYSYVSPEEILELAATPPLIVALDQITDPHNFGAIIRSAVGLGADGLITLKDRAAPVTAAVVRVSTGATEVARIARVVNLKRTLSSFRDAGLEIVGLDADGESCLEDLPYAAGGRVLVVGSEGHGLRHGTRQQCDTLARIRLPGPLQSLNASVAAGIAIYQSALARAGIGDGNETEEQEDGREAEEVSPPREG